MDRDDRLYSGSTTSYTSQRLHGQRDRDRILYTSALRRLAGVTQVAAAAEGHTYHNRLTHTLEVAQLARRIAERIRNSHPAETLDGLGGIDPDVVEAAALAHDLGHPPFGHVGESELDKAVKDAGVASGFEGNAQSFRIVSSLAMRTVEPSGLDLTRASLNAILKYPWQRAADGDESRKFGAYETETDAFEFARAGEPKGSKLKSLEAEVMDWADDVAYAVHDAYDFYRAGIIPLNVLAHSSAEWLKFTNSARAFSNPTGGVPSFDEAAAVEVRASLLEPFLPEDPFDSTVEHRGQLRAWSSVLITRFVRSDAFDVNLNYEPAQRRAQPDPNRKREVDLLKELTRYFVITNPATQGVQFGQRRIIRELFNLLVDDNSLEEPDDGTRTSPYPSGLAEAVEQTRQLDSIHDRARAKARVVADAISQMTEQQVTSLHRRLTGSQLGSMFDPIVR